MTNHSSTVLVLRLEKIMNGRALINSRWCLWFMLALSVVMTAEYARLVLTTDVATYRYFVLAAWIGLAIISLVRIVQFHTGSQTKQSANGKFK